MAEELVNILIFVNISLVNSLSLERIFDLPRSDEFHDG